MKTENSMKRNARRRGGVFAAVSLLVSLSWADGAQAADCLAAAYGGTLNCTSNDFTVSSVTVTNVDLNDCGGGSNTFTFDGTLNVGSGTTDRYDVGFYISNNSSNADVGSSCAVGVIPPGTGTADDGDQCGDYDGSANSYPVSNLTVTCQDSDGDGFFDFSICSAWAQNSQSTCNGPDDAVPGTAAKCECTTVNSDVEIPQCNTNADCSADANVCTDAVCLGLGQPGADFFGCAQVNNTVPCNDGLFCNGTDVCSGGTCGHSGNPCLGGGVCGDNCNETADNCFDLAGTPCRASAGVCDVAETCTGSTSDCPANGFVSSATQCRGSAGVCDLAENCTGSSAACPADSFASTASVCRASTGQCDVAENCTGTGASCPAETNTNGNSCNDGLFCTVSDVCTSGNCAGTARNCSDAIVCTDDTCDEANDECDVVENNANCDDGDACTEDVCSIAQGGCVSDYICAIDICRSAGYWSTHSGNEKKKKESINVGQEVLDLFGPFEICGQSVSATANAESPFLDGLGLDSSLEGLCMRAQGVKQRQLYRQLMAARFNCAVSGAADCDTITSKYIDVLWSDCSDVCAGNPPAIDPPTANECASQLGCFNNGGRVIFDGKCAYGTCENEPSVHCDGDYGDCPLFEEAPQACIPFEGNCHDSALCNEGIYCPKSTPASSPGACREARHNECTIDSCN
ncbi:MAG: hypothetical protein ABR538_01500 [Candidatus Binatia bacterium]